jgi:hypothetical protein
MSAKDDFHDSDMAVSGSGTSGGTAGAGGGADETDTVGTLNRKPQAAGSSSRTSEGTPGGNMTGAKGGTFGGTRDADEGATGLGVTDDAE